MEVSIPKKRGRRRVEMKKVEGKKKRSVTFSKRRRGLFNKACELSELSGDKIAMFVISEQGKPYSCGDVDSLLDQYVTGKVSDSNMASSSLEVKLIRKECKETLVKLEEEEKKTQQQEKTRVWWEKTVDETLEEWLMEYEAKLQELKKKVEGKLEEIKREKAKAIKASTSSYAHDQGVIETVDQVHHDELVDHDDDQYRVEDFLDFDGFCLDGGLFTI
ncbi:hypothetical protein ACOSP7_011451 [Xanthoceras sorbifolium]|uniref:MADS-box domain-containing protein n=1 Tax=Xanthoceras sorbifolium TaxID=99658 RepID=A0ABQ8HVT0_9ROSI|nr:hypothetical protein JRO89_XS06G0005000 [Xanthoceras sorbifolium]